MTAFLDRLRDHLEGIDGDYVPAIVAQEFVDLMAADHPAEYAEWVQAIAVEHCRTEITRLSRSDRAKANRRAKARRFSDIDDDAESTLDVFRLTYVVDEKNTRRPVADMTGSDHRFVAQGYEASGNHDLLLASFHTAVAKKVGRRRTGEVMDASTYERLMESILGNAA